MDEGDIVILVSVFFGWILGLISTLTIDIYKAKVKKKKILKLLRSDLIYLINRLTYSYFLLNYHTDEVNKDEIDKLRRILTQYSIEFNEKLSNALVSVDLQKYVDQLQQVQSTNASLSLKTFSLIFTESNLSELIELDSDIQIDILWVIDRIKIINQEISFSLHQSQLTFLPETMDRNAKTIQSNIKKSYINIRSQIAETVFGIDKVLQTRLKTN